MNSQKKRFLQRSATAFLVLLLFVSSSYYFWPNILGGIIPLTGMWRYHQLLSWIRSSDYPADSDVLAIFPRSIPEHATNTRLYFRTPPGDMELQLRCTLPAAEVATLVKHIAPSALATAKGQEQTYAWDQQRITMPAPILEVGEPAWQRKLPESFTMYVTHVGQSQASKYNSFWVYQSGIAVDPRTNDVIYWVEAYATGGVK